MVLRIQGEQLSSRRFGNGLRAAAGVGLTLADGRYGRDRRCGHHGNSNYEAGAVDVRAVIAGGSVPVIGAVFGFRGLGVVFVPVVSAQSLCIKIGRAHV